MELHILRFQAILHVILLKWWHKDEVDRLYIYISQMDRENILI
jgi:hypothetical protein